MNTRIRTAVVGKGGSGKSTVAGSLARLISQRGKKTLALDSDPMPGMALSLGLGNLQDAMLTEAVEKDHEGRWQLKSGIGAARAVSRFSVEAPDGVRFIQYGKADMDGVWSIFGSVTGFGKMVHRIARDDVLSQWSIVGDLAAGTRQTAYDWAPYADTYIIVVEPTWKSVLTGRRIARLATQRGANQIWTVANKVGGADDIDLVATRMEMEPKISIASDDSVRQADQKGLALLDYAPDSDTAGAINRLVDFLDSEIAAPHQ